jgi:hypothetical protein
MGIVHLDTLTQIETAINEAVGRIERQRQMIAEFETRGYDVSAPLKLLSCLIVNLRALEDRRRQQLNSDVVAL